MKGNDEITDLFRSRLSGSEMMVRDGFWEELRNDLPRTHVFATPLFYRVAAAASVALVLGAASAAFWYFSPKEEIQDAFTKVATLAPEASLNGDVVQEQLPSIYEAEPAAQSQGHKYPVPTASGMASVADDDEEETVSLTVSITISQRTYGNRHQSGSRYGQTIAAEDRQNYRTAAATPAAGNSETEAEADSGQAFPAARTESVARKWALKVGAGTSLPKGDFGMPFTAGLTVERSLNSRFSLETGLQYSRLDGDRTIHALAVPVKLNATLASMRKVDLYATLGGAAEKCVGGAEDNSFSAEPVQLSVAAGLGVRYRLNNPRIALFAETTVSHHFDTDSPTRTVRTERPTNLNLLCGVRMTY